MREIAPSQVGSIDSLIEQFELAQAEAVARFDGLIEAARKVQHQRNLFEEIIMTSSDAIFVVEERSGIILNVNQGAEKLLGYKGDDLRGRRQITLFPEDLHESLKQEFHQLRQEGGISNLRTRMQRADGSQVDVHMSANALSDAYEGLTVGFARDITDQVTAEEDLRALNETLEKRVEQRTQEIRLSNEELEMAIREANRNAAEAEQANKAKSLFLANVTHEIRTPLNAVVGLLDLMGDMDLGPMEKDTLHTVSRSAGTLATLINDILDFSKIEAGKTELEQVTFILPELLKQIIEVFSFQAGEKKLKLELDWDKGLPEFVVGDPGRLRQVLANLLGNALKFTEQGAVTLKVERIALEGRRHSIGFAVKDSGVGIAKDRQQAIFEPFVQADPSITRKFGGTGLGLNIAAKLVGKMGGRLEVDSEPGKGSTFSFTAHFAKPTRQQIDDHRDQTRSRFPAKGRKDGPANAAGRGGPSPLKVLLAEDNKLNQRVAQGMLARLGYEPDIADNGQQALDKLNGKVYDLVFMDLQMPEMGGLEAVRRIREGEGGEANRHVPVIAMTAHASREDRKSCLAAGMSDYVAKPVSGELIKQAIARVLAAAGPGPRQSGEGDSFYSMEPLVARSHGDEAIAQEVLDLFMGDARQKLNLIIGALQAYDFAFATVESRNLESRARDVHAAGVASLAGELIIAAESKQQEFALSLAGDIKAELLEMESVI